MNQLQQVELTLLKEFINVCRQLEIPYFLVCGSALGASKYKGFIPWDDDVDVGLLRPDYERFIKEAPEMLPDTVFLQNYRSDPAFPHVQTKLRMNNTTLIEKGMCGLPIHHGIYIDIFPLDGYPKGRLAAMYFEIRKKILGWKRCCALTDTSNWKVRIRNPVLRALGYHRRTAATLAAMEKMFMRYPPEDSQLWCNFGNWQGKLEYAPRAQYGKGTTAVFEGMEVIIPEDYDAYLTQKYGDWRSDPPLEKRKSHHDIVRLDPDNSYTKYI